MACYDQIASLLSEGVFFAHPATHWERAVLTKTPTACCVSTSPSAPDLSTHSPQWLRDVEDRLNKRPRKS